MDDPREQAPGADLDEDQMEQGEATEGRDRQQQAGTGDPDTAIEGNVDRDV